MSNTNKTSGQGFGTSVNRKEPTTQAQSQSQTPTSQKPASYSETVKEAATQAQQAAIALKQADLAYAAQALDRQRQQFEHDVDQIKEGFKVFMGPELKVLTAFLGAVDDIENDRPELPKLYAGGYEFLPPELPTLRGFSAYYPAVSQSQPQLGASTNNSEPIEPLNS